MNLKTLSELGEWAALGFYDAVGQDLPWPVNYGRARRYMYENMDVRVPEDKHLIPCEPFFMSENMDTHRASIRGRRRAGGGKGEEWADFFNPVGDIVGSFFPYRRSRIQHEVFGRAF